MRLIEVENICRKIKRNLTLGRHRKRRVCYNIKMDIEVIEYGSFHTFRRPRKPLGRVEV
jgi:hypothetical protein